MAARMPITPERESAFLAAYIASGGSFSAGCRAGSPHLDDPESPNPPGHQSWRDHLKRSLSFAERFEEARQQIADELIAIATQRIREGTEEPILYKGEQGTTHDGKPAVRVKHHDQLLLAKLRALLPEYRDHRHVHHHVHNDRWQISSADLEAFTRQQLQEFMDLLSVISDHRAHVAEQVAADDAEFELIEAPHTDEDEEIEVPDLW